MKKNRIILSLAVVLWLTSSVSAATIDRIAVRSEAMKKEIPVVVIVPDAAKSGVRMPVLYLLHGYSGDQETWLNVKPSLPQMADRDSVIVVCPDGENSWYWDSPKDPSSRFETFVARELIDYVDAHYPTRGDRSGRAITGLSMGGQAGCGFRSATRIRSAPADRRAAAWISVLSPRTGKWPNSSARRRPIARRGTTIR